MTEIVNRGAPHLAVKKVFRAEIACPNCQAAMQFDAHDVDIGHVVKCDKCKKHTYYPFERPWYRRRKLVAGYVISLLVSFGIGVAGNYVHDKYFGSNSSDAPSRIEPTK